MISVPEALAHIDANIIQAKVETISLDKSYGRILAEEIFTDRPLPPYDRVAMDGIAIKSTDFIQGIRSYEIAGIAAAGSPQMSLSKNGSCIEIMTGAVTPAGADVIIRYEDVEIKGGVATIHIDTIKEYQNIHRQGSDIAQDTLVLGPGIKISPTEIGILASVGKGEVMVTSLPKTVILSTGDELIDVDQAPAPHQIRKSNVHTIANILKPWRIDPDLIHINDNKQEIHATLSSLLSENQLIIMSGGVSKGKFDYIPEVLQELGVQKIFHRVRQRPGKPLWFGRTKETVIFGLPGNPVSSYACTYIYIHRWIQNSLNAQVSPPMIACLDQDFTFKPDLHLFLPVTLYHSEQGRLMATPQPGNGSGDFVNLAYSNALMEVPQGQTTYKKGTLLKVIKTR